MKHILLVFVTALALPAVARPQAVGVFTYLDAEQTRHCWCEDCPDIDLKNLPIYTKLQKQVSALNEDQIAKLFKHDEPLVRLAAMNVAGKKKLKLVYTDSLRDNHPLVRQAARQNLKAIHGVDFGPPPKSTQVDGIIAHRMWAKHLKEAWTEGLCENQYDRYYFDTYQQKYVLRTAITKSPQIEVELKAIKKLDTDRE